MLGNVNVCSYQIALEKIFKMESTVLKKTEKDKGRITCPTLLVFLSVDRMSEAVIVEALTAFPARSLFIQLAEKYPVNKAGNEV